MVIRTLSAALIALLLATPLAAAWCEACIQDRCDMFEANPGMTSDAHGPMAMHGSGTDDAAASSHSHETSAHDSPAHASGTPSGHCADMAGASPNAPDSETGIPAESSCCMEATTDEVQLALVSATPLSVHVDSLPSHTTPDSATLSMARGPVHAELAPRPPPRPLFTLHSLLLI